MPKGENPIAPYDLIRMRNQLYTGIIYRVKSSSYSAAAQIIGPNLVASVIEHDELIVLDIDANTSDRSIRYLK